MARILIIIAESSSSGHLDYAHFRMLEEGFDVTIAAPVKKPLRTVVFMPRGLDGTWDTAEELPGLIIEPDASLDEIDPSEFDALIGPGGRGTEHLRFSHRCIEIVRHFLECNKPMAFICCGAQIIAEAIAAAGMKGRRLVGEDAVKADVIAAGCTWEYTPGKAVVDGNIVTAWRRPDYDVWMREFVCLLKERGIKPS